MNDYRLALTALQILVLIMAYLLEWRKEKDGKFMDIVKSQGMLKSLVFSYITVFGIFLIIIMMMRILK